MALVVITGGARSGKSQVAERLAYARYCTGKQVTVAVFGNPDGDDVEFAERIKNHRDARPAEFNTVEAFHDVNWMDKVDDDHLLVIDSLGTALSAIMATREEEGVVGDRIDLGGNAAADARTFYELVDRIIAREGDTIVICNEAGGGLVPEWESGRRYRDMNSYGNRKLVAAADAAYLCVCGHLLDLTDLPTELSWPED